MGGVFPSFPSLKVTETNIVLIIQLVIRNDEKIVDCCFKLKIPLMIALPVYPLTPFFHSI